MSDYQDLFGERVQAPQYRTAENAHADFPGSGPEGESCATCRHRNVRYHHTRWYHKCGLVPETRGAGTDIRLKDPACSRWMQRRAEQE